MLRNLYHRLLSVLHLDRRDTAVFLLSLLLALSIWMINTLSRDFTGELTVNVRAVCGQLEGHMYRSEDEHPVTARCRTSAFRLIRAKTESRREVSEVEFDAADLQHVAGDTYSISAEVLDKYADDIFGKEISVSSILTRSISFVFPGTTHIKVPVKWEGSLSYRPQFMPEDALVMSPDSVVIYGEPRSLEGISYVSTENRSFSDIDEPLQGTIRLKAPRGLRLSHDEVAYSQNVYQYVELSREVPVIVDNVPSGKTVQAFPSKVRVVMRCRFAPDHNPTDLITAMHVDYRDFESSRTGMCIPATKVTLPYNVFGYRVEPRVVTCMEITSRK